MEKREPLYTVDECENWFSHFFCHTIRLGGSQFLEVKPAPSAVKAQSLNHWTSREFPSAATLENSTEVSQNIKNRTTT